MRNENIVWMWPIWVSPQLARGSERWRRVFLTEIVLPYWRLSSWSRERILIACAQEPTEQKTLKPNPFSVQNRFFKGQSNCSFNLFFFSCWHPGGCEMLQGQGVSLACSDTGHHVFRAQHDTSLWSYVLDFLLFITNLQGYLDGCLFLLL